MENKIILSGNCSWCLEALFLRTKGVLQVESGFYSLKEYPEIAFSEKDKLEVVQITYDSSKLSLNDLFSVYFLTHNPTINSWIEKETFYPLCRPAVFYSSEEQKSALLEKMEQIKSLYETPLLTKIQEIKPNNFTLVEEKYRRYYENNPKDGFCLSIVNPKIEKMKSEYKHLFVSYDIKKEF
jgi:peptide-methionine (S)-S-oxide reductase